MKKKWKLKLLFVFIILIIVITVYFFSGLFTFFHRHKKKLLHTFKVSHMACQLPFNNFIWRHSHNWREVPLSRRSLVICLLLHLVFFSSIGRHRTVHISLSMSKRGSVGLSYFHIYCYFFQLRKRRRGEMNVKQSRLIVLQLIMIVNLNLRHLQLFWCLDFSVCFYFWWKLSLFGCDLNFFAWIR